MIQMKVFHDQERGEEIHFLSTSINKSRISAKDHAALTLLYVIKIHDDHTHNVPAELSEEYELNKTNQAHNFSLIKRPATYKFLKDALLQDLDDIPRWIWSYGAETCIIQRSAVVPRVWSERQYWLQAFELFLHLDC